MALVTGGMALAQMINNRKRDKEKAEAERLATRDKMEFDSKLLALELKQKECDKLQAECLEDRKVLREKHEKDIQIVLEKLSKCEEKHEKTDERFDKILALIVKRKEEIEEFRKGQSEQDSKIDKLRSDHDGRK